MTDTPPSLPQWMGLGIGQYLLYMSNILFPSVPQLPQKRVKCWAEDFVYLSGADGNFLSDEESDEDKTGFKIASPKEGCPKKCLPVKKPWTTTEMVGILSSPVFAQTMDI